MPSGENTWRASEAGQAGQKVLAGLANHHGIPPLLLEVVDSSTLFVT